MGRRPSGKRHWLFELVFTLAIAGVLVTAVQAYAVKPYKIPSGSMEPTLEVGDRVVADRFSHRILGSDPEVGQIVVFTPPSGADDAPATCGAVGQGHDSTTACSVATDGEAGEAYIKRVVAVGGDRIAIRDGHVIRNGRREADPYAAPCTDNPVAECDFPDTITVPKGSVYLLGDNRGNSEDSRFWGPVPVDHVIGRAVAVYWPPKDIGAP